MFLLNCFILIQKHIVFFYIELDTQPEEYIFSPVDLCLNFYFFPSEIDRIDLRGSKLNNKKK